MIEKELLDILCCPVCKTQLKPGKTEDYLVCNKCKLKFPVEDGVPYLLRSKAQPVIESISENYINKTKYTETELHG